ncbi:hypothetical protein BGZ96_012694 [Linnemannia gamsii]|uniref:Nidogen G2 beta-barrel domain-containing protein n=1 Tax=Linnemannia gamsii TaxID=64522 RepID=A0ABQ7KC83_9FUNG|nr:hypothetical protein BGZ96_012694 [Linnemannia gamsii]
MASNSNMLQATTLNAFHHPQDSSLEANVYLELDGEERESALRSGCVYSVITIVFPWNMTRFESLKIQNRNKGMVNFWLPHYNEGGSDDIIIPGRTTKKSNSYSNNVGARAGLAALVVPTAQEWPGMVIDRLDIKVNDGSIYFLGGVITEELKAVSEQGAVIGGITAEKRIELESKLRTRLSLSSNSNYSELDLKVSAETTAEIRMVKTIYMMVPWLASPD